MSNVCTCKLCREFEPPIKKSSLLALFRYMKEEPPKYNEKPEKKERD